uniref:NAD(P)/FAD-dependent oxidoreductase n=1 Tax=Anaeromyxobacter oryzisoli TaxID=2925408 RepID=UPI001F5847BF
MTAASGRVRDAVVVGGGPAGLAFAIAAARRGLDVAVLERGAAPLDRACGEGLLPAGVRALGALGVLPLLPSADTAPVWEIRWYEPGGGGARVALPAPGGLGVRRTALRAALRARAVALGVEVREGAEVIAHRRAPGEIRAELAGGDAVAARVLVAADGRGSPVRRREGLDRPVAGPPRFGIRRHFALAPWADAVEVHFGDRAEAYVTPAGARRVGIAFLLELERGGRARYDELLGRFPALAARVAGAP